MRLAGRVRPARMGMTILSCGLAVASAAPTFAATKRERALAADQMVQDALRAEADGYESQERERLLQSALETAPDHEGARWQSGQVKWNKQWTPADKLPEKLARDSRWTTYEKLRADAEATVEDQLRLAEWCRGRGMQDQERAHLTQVLELAPDHLEARARLGFARANGGWVHRDEVAASAAEGKELVGDLDAWRSKATKIAKSLLHRSEARRAAAQKDLAAIDDARAIPALELCLATSSEATAELLVETLARFQVNRATLALARQAVFSPWPAVRTSAAVELRSRPRESYLPVLLSSMYTPVQTRAELFEGRGGRLVYRHAFVREGQNAREVGVIDTAYRDRGGKASGSGNELEQALVDANDRFQLREQQVERQNAFTDELNERISAAITTATGEPVSRDPAGWWKWWNDYNEVFTDGPKEVRTLYEAEQITVEDTTGGGEAYDCLARGTLVWTARGQVAIEKVQIGDLVLSQNPDTGELAYKPVLRTTVRPPSKLVTLRVGTDTIATSGGHLFWASGAGWAKSREIREGAMLHGLRGAVDVAAASRGNVAETYNLIVADFHTYFVGQERILSHDNTVRRATDAVVPGLKAKN